MVHFIFISIVIMLYLDQTHLLLGDVRGFGFHLFRLPEQYAFFPHGLRCYCQEAHARRM